MVKAGGGTLLKSRAAALSAVSSGHPTIAIAPPASIPADLPAAPGPSHFHGQGSAQGSPTPATMGAGVAGEVVSDRDRKAVSELLRRGVQVAPPSYLVEWVARPWWGGLRGLRVGSLGQGQQHAGAQHAQHGVRAQQQAEQARSASGGGRAKGGKGPGVAGAGAGASVDAGVGAAAAAALGRLEAARGGSVDGDGDWEGLGGCEDSGDDDVSEAL